MSPVVTKNVSVNGRWRREVKYDGPHGDGQIQYTYRRWRVPAWLGRIFF